MADPRYLPAGECALVVEFGETAERAFHDRVLALDAALAAAPIEGVLEIVPTYRSLMLHFDPRVLTTEGLIGRVQRIGVEQREASGAKGRRWRLPACYDGRHGEDLDELAGKLERSREDIAALHADAEYRVVMYGFAPGFVFLAGLPEALKISRRETPRAAAAPGALTIANGQALIASIAMPTGWYVLGRTPARTFDAGRDPVFPLAVGDTVTFERIDPDRFEVLAGEVASGADLLTADASRAGS